MSNLRVGNVVYGSNLSQGHLSQQIWPQQVWRERNYVCKCGASLKHKRLAVETKPVGDTAALEVKRERGALVCDKCGVICWERS